MKKDITHRIAYYTRKVENNDDLELLIRGQEYIKLLLQDRNMNNFEDED
ncbi:hypothetical protein [Neobacillus niacini]|nr:hypothetical protein [Neobacillus niacini]MCM3764607.1 hypothetical protein [Neobacillus niacini]